MYYVYAYLRENGSPYYIGKGTRYRAWHNHNDCSARPPKDKSRIIIMEANLTEVGALALERFYIRWYGKKCDGTGILRNINDGGDGGTPWNKGKKGLWTSPYKDVRGRYDDKSLERIREGTKRAMANLSPDKRKAMCDVHRNCVNKVWIHDSNGKHKRVKQEDLDSYILLGWCKGRKMYHDPKTGKFTKHIME